MANDPFQADIEKAYAVIQEGGVILYPTDTVWGIGCDATNEAAINRVFQIKQRVESKSLIILLDSFEKIYRYIEKVPDIAADLLSNMTTPTTVIYSNVRNLPPNLHAADRTIAIRIPKDDFCQQLLRKLDKPLVSTSANISGEPTAITFSQISEEIKSHVDYIVEYKQDMLIQVKTSTMVRLYEDGNYDIIRK